MDAPQDTAPAPAAPAAPAPATEGMVSMTQAEADQLRTHEATGERYRVNAEGLKPWMLEANGLGIKSIEDFAGVRSVLDALPAGLNRAAQAEYIRAIGSGQTPPEAPAVPEFDAEAAFGKLETNMKFESAKDKHQSAVERQNAAFEKRMLEFYSENASAESKHGWMAAGRAAMLKARVLYADGHPLVNHDVMPLDDVGMDSVFKALAETRTGFEAANLAAAGDKANKPKPKATPTPAGSGDAQGEPNTKTPVRAPGRPMGATRESMQAHADRLRVAREKGPISTLGG